MILKDPYFLFLLLLLPLVLVSSDGTRFIAILFKFLKRKQENSFAFATHVDLKILDSQRLVRERFLVVNFLRMMAYVFLVIALTRPQIAGMIVDGEETGKDIMLVLDVSGSMQAMDFEINSKRVDRLTALKNVVSDFIEKQQGNRLAVVIFGKDVYTQCPLTLDLNIVKELVGQLGVGMLGDGTSLGDGLALAVKKMRSIKENSKAIILVTDGVKNSGSIEPMEAAKIAKDNGIKVYSIGIGSNRPAPFPVTGVFGQTQLQYQDVEFDEKVLKDIAELSEGKYFNAQNTTELKNIYQEISSLEERKSRSSKYQLYQDNFLVFLIIAILFFIIVELLENYRYKIMP